MSASAPRVWAFSTNLGTLTGTKSAERRTRARSRSRRSSAGRGRPSSGVPQALSSALISRPCARSSRQVARRSRPARRRPPRCPGPSRRPAQRTRPGVPSIRIQHVLHLHLRPGRRPARRRSTRAPGTAGRASRRGRRRSAPPPPRRPRMRRTTSSRSRSRDPAADRSVQLVGVLRPLDAAVEPRRVDDSGTADQPHDALGDRLGAGRDGDPLPVARAVRVARRVVRACGSRCAPGTMPSWS